MRIGLLSDTHGFLDDKIFYHFQQVDEVWHAGDIGDAETLRQLAHFKPLKAVYGNIDPPEVRREWPEDFRFNCAGLDVLITHIGGFPPNYNKRVRQLLEVNTPGLFICGHSHILRILTDTARKGMLYMNPGAAGRQGFHKTRTMVRFTINRGTISELQVIELGSRA